jgi:hypothetical protein
MKGTVIAVILAAALGFWGGRQSVEPPESQARVEIVNPVKSGETLSKVLHVGNELLTHLSEGGTVPSCLCQSVVNKTTLWCDHAGPICDPETARQCEGRYEMHRCFPGTVTSIYPRK